MALMEHTIDYGWGIAHLYVEETDPEKVVSLFYNYANQCFGIRKCITKDPVVTASKPASFPPYLSDKTAAMLTHDGGDTITWDAEGNKLKSEWDG